MCGIVGYIGFRSGVAECLRGLERLEYRGYDSSGVAAIDMRGSLSVRRAVGGVSNLTQTIDGSGLVGRTAIGHTRWATHGEPSEQNAHPHVDCTGRFAVVHNGIVENHVALRAELKLKGHKFHSETDTEVIAHLVEEAYEEEGSSWGRSALSRAVFAERSALRSWSPTETRPRSSRHDRGVRWSSVWGKTRSSSPPTSSRYSIGPAGGLSRRW